LTANEGLLVMRRIAHGSVWFKPEDEERVLKLMRLQCSAIRSAYQSIHGHGLRGNDVRKRVKKNYMSLLDQRWVSDACTMASMINQDHALFGGRKAWRDLLSKNLSKSEWLARRNSQLWSQGDRSRRGNLHIRLDGDKLLVRDPAGKWIEGKAFMSKKFKPDLSCYDVRLIHRNGKFKFMLGWEQPSPVPIRVADAIGLDANPDGVAITEVGHDGNLLSHHYLRAQRIQFASQNKRDNDIRLLAKEIVGEAITKNKKLVVEQLDFRNRDRSSGCRKFRRMKSNYLYHKILKAVKSRAARYGVELVEVNPAFTSILGELKYQKMYSLNGHAAAALVIARRGMGIRERQDFTVTPTVKGKSGLNLEGRGHGIVLSPKAWSWLGECFLKSKPARLTASCPAPSSILGIGHGVGETPTGESLTTTGRQGVVQHNSAEEGPPLELGQFVQVSQTREF
jgi:IS605 OrfB family transposase